MQIKKDDQLECEKTIQSIELKQEKLEREGRENLVGQKRRSKAEIKTLEVTRDLFTKLQFEPCAVNNKLIAFLVKSIKEKEAALECPVCLETVKAPIFMCQQQHLVCFKYQPRLASCPKCRETYQEQPGRHRYAERDAEELEKMQNELANLTD